MRAVWEALKNERLMEKEMKRKDAKISKLEQRSKKASAIIRGQKATIAHKNKVIRSHEAAIRHKNKVIRGQKAAISRKSAAIRQRNWTIARQQQTHWRKQRQVAELRRMERLRRRDPIHVYALDDGCSGNEAAHWRLVLGKFARESICLNPRLSS